MFDIKLLEEEFLKDLHGLNHSDISNFDKTFDNMDKQLTARICSWQVIDKLMGSWEPLELKFN
jgi:hypothetical protein